MRRIVNINIMNDSVVCRITRSQEMHLVYLWEESYEDFLIENNGWKLVRLPMTLFDFLNYTGTKLLSSPYWTCLCKEDYLKIHGVESVCPVCGKEYPHQRPGFIAVKSFFDWENVLMLRPKEIPEVDEDEMDDDDDDDEEEEENTDIIRSTDLHPVKSDQRVQTNEQIEVKENDSQRKQSNIGLNQLGKHELQSVSKQLVKGKLLEHFKEEITSIQEGNLRSPMTVHIGKREITIQVKSKRQDFWPKVKGITGSNVFIIFVDYAGKQDTDLADFYIVNSKDFRSVMEMRIAEILKKGGRARIDDTNTLIFEDRNRVGTNVKADHLISFKNDWSKLSRQDQ